MRPPQSKAPAVGCDRGETTEVEISSSPDHWPVRPQSQAYRNAKLAWASITAKPVEVVFRKRRAKT
jgi:hypothetical protein